MYSIFENLVKFLSNSLLLRHKNCTPHFRNPKHGAVLRLLISWEAIYYLQDINYSILFLVTNLSLSNNFHWFIKIINVKKFLRQHFSNLTFYQTQLQSYAKHLENIKMYQYCGRLKSKCWGNLKTMCVGIISLHVT